PGSAWSAISRRCGECDADCDVTQLEHADLSKVMMFDGDRAISTQITDLTDLGRCRSILMDLQRHGYEPGGRRFESCWARHKRCARSGHMGDSSFQAHR